MRQKKLKLFVWENVLADYTNGMMVAFAPNVEEARKLLAEKIGYQHQDLQIEPKVITSPDAFYIYGGS